MQLDSGHALAELAVDGGMSNSDLCMQTQADLIGIPVYRPKYVQLDEMEEHCADTNLPLQDA